MTEVKDPIEKLRKGALLSVFITIFLDLVGFGMLIPILPLIARDFGASDAQATALASIYSIGTLLAVGILGRWSDVFGRKKILIGTIFVSIIAQFMTGFAPTYPLLVIARFVAGLASGNIAVAQACISDITSPKERGKSMALIGIAFGLGFALGPALGAAISAFSEGHSLFVVSMVAAGLNIFNLILALRRLPETHQRFAKGTILELVNRIKGELSESNLGTWWQDAKRLLSDRAFCIVLLLAFLQVFGFVGVESVLALALSDAYALTTSKQQYFAFMYIGIMLLFINGGITRRLIGPLGEIRILTIGQFLLGTAMLILPFFAPNKAMLWTSLTLVAAGSAFASPALSSLSSRLAPEGLQGFALGFSQTLGSLARIVGPITFGVLYQSLHGPRSLYLTAAIMMVGLVIAMIGLRGVKLRLAAQVSPG
ncbi:MAG: MFS transporter [Proteobacteria bacterium]|nr:MAG: MFS transporter [Pseudomonadota bacterium]